MELRPVWAHKIEDLRNARGLSQAELADGMNAIIDENKFSRSFINHLELGERPFKAPAICALAEYFGCSADYILGRTDSASSDKDLRFICDHTGLSDEAISVLNDQKGCFPLLNRFISSIIDSGEWEKILNDISAAMDCAAIQETDESKQDSRSINTGLHIREKLEKEGLVYTEHQEIPKGKVVLSPEEGRDFYIDHSARLFSNYVGKFICDMLGGENNGK